MNPITLRAISPISDKIKRPVKYRFIISRFLISTIGPKTKKAATGAVPNRLNKEDPINASASEQRDIVKANNSMMIMAKIFVEPSVSIILVGK